MEKFTWEKFKGSNDMAVHCKTEKEAESFCKMMSEHDMTWCDGTPYLDRTFLREYKDRTFFCEYKDETCYDGTGEYCDYTYYLTLGYHIYEYSDIVEGVENVNLKTQSFKVGDRVLHGSFGKGIVLEIMGAFIGVKFDEKNLPFHDLDGLCEPGYGWWCSYKDLVLLNDRNSQENEIKITFKGEKTIATEFVNHKYSKHSTSQPYYTDKYNDKIGIIPSIIKMTEILKDDMISVIKDMYSDFAKKYDNEQKTSREIEKALNKQIAKKMVHLTKCVNEGYYCPTCNKRLFTKEITNKHKCCYNCGQRIDYSACEEY